MSVDALTVERWVGEGIIKCAHIVLSSRIYRCSRTLPPRSRSNWVRVEPVVLYLSLHSVSGMACCSVGRNRWPSAHPFITGARPPAHNQIIKSVSGVISVVHLALCRLPASDWVNFPFGMSRSSPSARHTISTIHVLSRYPSDLYRAMFLACSDGMPFLLQFKLEVEEVDDAVPDLAKYRHDVSQPLVIQVRFNFVPGAAEVCLHRLKDCTVVFLAHHNVFVQILQQQDDDSGRETVVEQWDLQFDGVPPTHHLCSISYDDEPTKIYKRMVRVLGFVQSCMVNYVYMPSHKEVCGAVCTMHASIAFTMCAVCHGTHSLQLRPGPSCVQIVQGLPGSSWGSIQSHLQAAAQESSSIETDGGTGWGSRGWDQGLSCRALCLCSY